MQRNVETVPSPKTHPGAPEALRDEELLRVTGGKLTCRKSGGTAPVEYLTYTLNNVLISG